MRILRVLRGIAKSALTWAVIWAPVSLIPFGLLRLFGSTIPTRILVPLLLNQALTGAANGVVFASVLAIAGRRKTFETLTLPWMAMCGAVGGVLFPFAGRAVLLAMADFSIPVTAWVSTLVANAVLGAGCAALTLSVARRAPALPGARSALSPTADAGAS